jgi:hypothetical protein
MMKTLFASFAFVFVVGCAAAPDEPPAGTDVAAVTADGASCDDRPGARADEVVQAGAGLIPLAITEDDHVVYQDGHTVYATALAPGARRARIAEVPAGNTAFVYASGPVAFVWTNPDPTSPSLGVSPLVVWTARHGAHLASDASAVGTLLTAASPDGRRVVFPSHATAAGTVSDVVEASTDLRHVTTLLSGVQSDFANGPCRPLGAYLRDDDAYYPAIAYCASGATLSTISMFRHHARRDVDGLANPPRMTVDVARTRILTIRPGAASVRSGTPLLVTEAAVTPIEDVRANLPLWNRDGSAIYLAIDPALRFSLRAARFHGTAATTRELAPTVATVFGQGFGSTSLIHPLTSRDGRWLAYAANSDPATGLTDLAVVDLRAGGTPATLDASLTSTSAAPEEPFTTDSRFALYARINAATGAAQMFAARIGGRDIVPLSDTNAFNELPASGSDVVISDNVTFSATNFAQSTADLKVVDPAQPGGAPRLIARQANIGVFVDQRRRRIAYVTDDAAAPGLHVARVR